MRDKTKVETLKQQITDEVIKQYAESNIDNLFRLLYGLLDCCQKMLYYIDEGRLVPMYNAALVKRGLKPIRVFDGDLIAGFTTYSKYVRLAKSSFEATLQKRINAITYEAADMTTEEADNFGRDGNFLLTLIMRLMECGWTPEFARKFDELLASDENRKRVFTEQDYNRFKDMK